VWNPDRNGSGSQITLRERSCVMISATALSGPQITVWLAEFSWEMTTSGRPASSEEASSGEQPSTANSTPGTRSASRSAFATIASNAAPETMPPEIIAAHSPTLCPATAAGRMPSRRTAVSSSRPTVITAAPCLPSVVVESSGTGSPKCSATSSTCGAKSASRPGKTNATPAPPASSGRGLYQRSPRLRTGFPFTTNRLAAESRFGEGSTTPRRGPGPR
jgi:hypothetical protein